MAKQAKDDDQDDRDDTEEAADIYIQDSPPPRLRPRLTDEDILALREIIQDHKHRTWLWALVGKVAKYIAAVGAAITVLKLWQADVKGLFK